jgi:hypothetical protein
MNNQNNKHALPLEEAAFYVAIGLSLPSRTHVCVYVVSSDEFTDIVRSPAKHYAVISWYKFVCVKRVPYAAIMGNLRRLNIPGAGSFRSPMNPDGKIYGLLPMEYENKIRYVVEATIKGITLDENVKPKYETGSNDYSKILTNYCNTTEIKLSSQSMVMSTGDTKAHCLVKL